MERKLSARITVRLYTDEKCFGPGIAALLRQVEEYHSLRSAAASMGMAYSKAWTILKSCEEQLGFKLVHSTVGGKNGGGTALTENAEKMLQAYEEYCADLKNYAEQQMDKRFSFFHREKTEKSGSIP